MADATWASPLARRLVSTDSMELVLELAGHQELHGVLQWSVSVQDVEDLLRDRHLDLQASRELMGGCGGEEALGDRAIAREVGPRIDALGDLLAERPVARKIAGTGEEEVAHAGQAEERERVRSERNPEARDL